MPPGTARRVPGVNLLAAEDRDRRRAERLRARIGTGLAATVLLLAVPAGIAWGQVRGEQEQLDDARAEGAHLQAASEGYGQVVRLATDVDRTEVQLSAAMGSEVRWSRYLADLSRTVSDDAWLLYLGASVDEPARGDPIGQVRLTGRARTHDDVAALLAALPRQRGTGPAYLVDSRAGKDEGGRDVVDFEAYATLRPELLSRRYVLQGGR